MASKTTYYAEWNGETYTRTSARAYSHAAVYRNADGAEFVGSYHSRADLAAKGVNGRKPIAVVEATTTPDAKPAPVVEVEAEEMCPNTGVENPKRVASKCRDCGKEGTVNRRTGTLRAHKPANTKETVTMSETPNVVVEIKAENLVRRARVSMVEATVLNVLPTYSGGVAFEGEDTLRGPLAVELSNTDARWLLACLLTMKRQGALGEYDED